MLLLLSKRGAADPNKKFVLIMKYGKIYKNSIQ